jgi:hypothetical protein
MKPSTQTITHVYGTKAVESLLAEGTKIGLSLDHIMSTLCRFQTDADIDPDAGSSQESVQKDYRSFQALATAYFEGIEQLLQTDHFRELDPSAVQEIFNQSDVILDGWHCVQIELRSRKQQEESTILETESSVRSVDATKAVESLLEAGTKIGLSLDHIMSTLCPFHTEADTDTHARPCQENVEKDYLSFQALATAYFERIEQLLQTDHFHELDPSAVQEIFNQSDVILDGWHCVMIELRSRKQYQESTIAETESSARSVDATKAVESLLEVGTKIGLSLDHIMSTLCPFHTEADTDTDARPRQENVEKDYRSFQASATAYFEGIEQLLQTDHFRELDPSAVQEIFNQSDVILDGWHCVMIELRSRKQYQESTIPETESSVRSVDATKAVETLLEVGTKIGLSLDHIMSTLCPFHTEADTDTDARPRQENVEKDYRSFQASATAYFEGIEQLLQTDHFRELDPSAVQEIFNQSDVILDGWHCVMIELRSRKQYQESHLLVTESSARSVDGTEAVESLLEAGTKIGLSLDHIMSTLCPFHTEADTDTDARPRQENVEKDYLSFQALATAYFEGIEQLVQTDHFSELDPSAVQEILNQSDVFLDGWHCVMIELRSRKQHQESTSLVPESSARTVAGTKKAVESLLAEGTNIGLSLDHVLSTHCAFHTDADSDTDSDRSQDNVERQYKFFQGLATAYFEGIEQLLQIKRASELDGKERHFLEELVFGLDWVVRAYKSLERGVAGGL